jgi:hypothetical protein
MHAFVEDILQFTLNNKKHQHFQEKETRYSFVICNRNIYAHDSSVTLHNGKTDIHRNFDRFNVIKSPHRLQPIFLSRETMRDSYKNRPFSDLVKIVE